ncbi:ATP-binding protein [Streptomyces sp. NPDC007088]|uniref:ATP-binding protein n=1 Tax=Streptomyces sp. NPDC007088 TaxID=3364773 RepID=UPI0036B6D9D2
MASPQRVVFNPPAAEPRPFAFAADLPADREAIGPVRHDLEKQLHQAGLGHIADDFVLSAHELMANAVVHGCRDSPKGTITVTAICDGRRIRLSVEDPSAAQPHVRDALGEETGGRGLLIVAVFADCWGVRPPSEGVGKTVWMEMACTPPAGRGAA